MKIQSIQNDQEETEWLALDRTASFCTKRVLLTTSGLISAIGGVSTLDKIWD